MSVRTILLFLVALIMAGGTAFYARSLILAERNANALQTGIEEEIVVARSMMVLVATDTLTTGSFVKENSLEWQAWPEDGVNDSYISVYSEDLEEEGVDKDLRLTLEGAVARETVRAGQPVTSDSFIHPDERGFLAAVLRHGNRAVSVPINETTGISGFVFPGDRVDLVLSLKLRGKDVSGDKATRYASLTLIEDVRVLAVDQAIENEEGEPIVAKTATVEVDDKQAEKVALGLSMGTVSLSLRGLEEQQMASVGSATESALETFMKSGGKLDDNKGRNFTMDIEVFTVNGKDMSLMQPPPSKPKAKRETITVLRGNSAGKSGALPAGK